MLKVWMWRQLAETRKIGEMTDWCKRRRGADFWLNEFTLIQLICPYINSPWHILPHGLQASTLLRAFTHKLIFCPSVDTFIFFFGTNHLREWLSFPRQRDTYRANCTPTEEEKERVRDRELGHLMETENPKERAKHWKTAHRCRSENRSSLQSFHSSHTLI